jgi:peroxiredoxin
MGTSTLFKSNESEKGMNAPDIKGLEMLDGSIMSSLKDDSEVIYVVVFWATWCSRSRANLPTLNSYFKRYHNKADNVDFVGITAEPLSTVRAFLSRNVHRMNFPCASDLTGRVAKSYDVTSTPKAYVILDQKIQWSGIADTSLELAIKSAVYARKMKRVDKSKEKLS